MWPSACHPCGPPGQVLACSPDPGPPYSGASRDPPEAQGDTVPCRPPSWRLEAPGLDCQGSPTATLSAGPRGPALPSPALSPLSDLDGDLCGGCKRPLEVGPGDRGQDSQEAPRMRVEACPMTPPLGTVRPRLLPSGSLSPGGRECPSSPAQMAKRQEGERQMVVGLER